MTHLANQDHLHLYGLDERLSDSFIELSKSKSTVGSLSEFGESHTN